MTSGQKIAFSLLAALALFAVFVLSFNSTLFKELETRFYAQAKIEENTGQLDKISESCDSYISEILSLVEKGDNAWTKNASVRSYYVQNPSESEVNQRRRLTENLFAQIPALNGIRIVDKNGRNVHYSSFDDTDLLKQNGISKIYKNYNDIVKDAGEIDFELLQKITSETKAVLLCDEDQNRLILSVPFCWVDGIYSGIALFYLNLHEIDKELISREVISIGQSLTLYSDESYNGGFVLNLPHGSKTDFKTPFLSYWKSRSEALSRGSDSAQQPEKLLAMPDGRFYVSLSSNRIGKIRVSAVYTSDVFELSTEIRLLVYICIFISILLIVFLIFSFFRDPLVTLKKRIKKLQLGIIENYLDGKEKREWSDLARQLRQRRNDLSDEIIKSLHVHSKKRRKEISEYLEKNWDEIFAIFETKAGVSPEPAASSGNAGAAELTGASIAEIRRMLEEVLQNRNIVVPVAATAAAAGAAVAKAVPAPAPAVDEVEDLDDVEEIDEAEELDEVEEVEELAEDVEEAEEVEELAEDVEEAEEVEELAEDVEEAEEVEELAEDVEEAEEVEDLAEDVEEAEELDEVEEVEEAEEVEELAEDVEEVAEDIEEAEEVDEVEEVEEVEEIAEEPETIEEPVEELTEEEPETIDEPIDDVEEPEIIEGPVDDIEDVEELDEPEELDDVEELDEVEELEELEELDELEEIEPAPAPAARSNSFDNFIKTLAVPQKEYKPTNETYFASENFPNVENVFAEELKLGNYDLVSSHRDAVSIAPEIYPLPPYEAVEELTEEVPSYLVEPDFSMTDFADNLSQEVPELDSALAIPKGPDNAIVEKDGVFSISEDLEYTDVVQDQAFKQLVDSILS